MTIGLGTAELMTDFCLLGFLLESFWSIRSYMSWYSIMLRGVRAAHISFTIVFTYPLTLSFSVASIQKRLDFPWRCLMILSCRAMLMVDSALSPVKTHKLDPNSEQLWTKSSAPSV